MIDDPKQLLVIYIRIEIRLQEGAKNLLANVTTSRRSATAGGRQTFRLTNIMVTIRETSSWVVYIAVIIC